MRVPVLGAGRHLATLRAAIHVAGMASATYRLFRYSSRDEKQYTCSYHGRRREHCPLAVGDKDGNEMVLAFHFSGEPGISLPARGVWRCLHGVDGLDTELRYGSSHPGSL